MNHCLYCHHWTPIDQNLIEEGDGMRGNCGREDIRDWVRLFFFRARETDEGDERLMLFGQLLEDYDCALITNARYGCVCWEGDPDAET